MRITNSDQLLARLDAGANLKLEGGVVKTQNSFSHAMRKIGDFFRSLTAGGREAIRTRSENLRAAMANVLQGGMDRNLAAAANLPDAQALRSREGFDEAVRRIRTAREFAPLAGPDVSPRRLREAMAHCLSMNGVTSAGETRRRELENAILKAVVDTCIDANNADDAGRIPDGFRIGLLSLGEAMMRKALDPALAGDARLQAERRWLADNLGGLVAGMRKLMLAADAAVAQIQPPIQEGMRRSAAALVAARTMTSLGKQGADDRRANLLLNADDEELQRLAAQTAGTLLAPAADGRITPGLLALDFCTAPRTEADLRAMRDALQEDIGQAWAAQRAQHVDSQPDSIHDNWQLDMDRGGAIVSINGRLPAADYRRQIIGLVPNPAVRGFITFVTSQAGVQGSFQTGFMMGNLDGHSCSPDALPSFMAGGLTFADSHHPQSHCSHLEIVDGLARIRFVQRTDVQATPQPWEEHIGGADYEVEMFIPLDQDVPPGGIPQFTITDVQHERIRP